MKQLTRFFLQSNIFLLLFFAYLLFYLLHAFFLHKTVYGDGIYYYSYLRSMVVDHDINFQNEYAHFGISQPTTPTGFLSNVYAIGPALFWLPFYLPFHFLIKGNGYEFSYQLLIGFINVGYAISGLVLLYRLLTKFFYEKISTLAMIGIALSTNLFFYGSLDTVNSHAITFFLAVSIISRVVERRETFITGILIGLLSLVRSQEAIFLLLFFFTYPLFDILKAGVGTLVGFIPQFLTWQILYGTFIKSPYLDPYHYFDFLHPHLLDVLFSPNNGLLLWTPIIGIALIGLFLSSFPKQLKRIPFSLLLFTECYLIASWSFWWQGASYSGRMFISVLPILAFGLTAILKKLSLNHQIILISIFSLVNIGAIFYFLITH